MHQTRLDILIALRSKEHKSFSQLLADVAETSDNLTYHLRYLSRDGYVGSVAKGTYKLATKGFLFINTNQEKYDGIYPTVSCMLVIRTEKGRLLMKKLKHPHIGKLHDITFALHSGNSVAEQIEIFLDTYQMRVEHLTYKKHKSKIGSLLN